MADFYVLFNPKAGNGRGDKQAHKLDTLWNDRTLIYRDVTAIPDVRDFVQSLPDDAGVVLCGGDGTLNHFVNDMGGEDPGRSVYFFGTGSGNDFLKDIGRSIDDPPILLNPYMVDLPTVTVNGMTRYYLNGIGYGLDGYCCEEGDKIRATSDKPVNYTPIAVKGLAYGYKRCHAFVTVDGETTEFDKVWIAPCMKGRYFGGGMMCAPTQDRMDPTRKVSVMVMRSKSKLKALIVFPSIFKGTHIRHTDMVTILQGHDVSIRFDKPTALQIDGETVLNVTEYAVTTRHGAKQAQQETKEFANAG